MKHILLMTSGLTGILNASFEVVSRLKAAGYQCTYACPAPAGDIVMRQGIDFIQLEEVNFDPAPEVAINIGPMHKIRRWLYKVSFACSRRKQGVEALGMDRFLQTVSTVKPDLVIIDIELHEHIMALHTAKYKVLLLSQWFSTWNRKGLPPIGEDTIPGIGWKGSNIGMIWSWWKLKMQRWFIFTKKKIVTVATDRRSILKKFALECGFPLKYIRENYWPGPFSYDQLPVISMVAREMDFPHDMRPGHDYVGPMVRAERKEVNIDSMELARLSTILNTTSLKKKQLVYCSVSTFKAGDENFIKRVIKAFEGQENWVLIVSLGGLVKADNFKDLPKNVHAFEKVPQLLVLSHANLSINHGGIHTINECIHFKVLMLVYSGKRSDQNGCAARVHYHGLGIMADKDQDTFSDIRNKIMQILESKSIKLNIKRMNTINVNYRDQNILCDLIRLRLQEIEN